ncbi:LOW QUALITY PROTEIN: 50S ribosomal protein L1-like [Dioscorea cayenensis subsp. rotundata]|uniref:Large ribosomal subunit protein uL1c n=1 Tax=Dioscorea cayennensis subsp. rotundata TaxID=55577 RepID=A0AB40AR58_DIOCR|nr:LOW QUALITY PROTEIN: 50S ribosomal protein L1-like [Dioscorea cayenensis subsp. rotundata]
MARLELLFSHGRRHLSAPKPPFLGFLRFFSSDSSTVIKPISYPVKPQESSSSDAPSQTPAPQPESDSSSARPEATVPDSSSEQPIPRPWTRADARFVKDAPRISPVSYPTKVAPLPEDRTSEATEGGDDALKREAREIESNERVKSYFRVQAEEVIPFPTLIKQEKRPQKLPMDLGEAIREMKASTTTKKRNFLETVEAHVNLGVDPRRGDQMVRGALTLPHGSGKTVRVAVFAEGAAAEEAKAAGADIVGGDELIEEIKTGGGKINFDKCIATPMFMPRLSKIARILGPRGLMPNPKLGSVTSNVSIAVKEAKSGRIDFKIDKTAIIHVGLGKVNFSDEALRENIGAFVNALLLAKPVGLKKTSKYAGYVKNFTLSSTMGPGFPVSIQSLSVAADNYVKLQVK